MAWFDKYELTGDDVVIFDKHVAQKYVALMALLGLEINQKKSVVSRSHPVGEYLKKTWIRNLDVSMVS